MQEGGRSVETRVKHDVFKFEVFKFEVVKFEILLWKVNFKQVRLHNPYQLCLIKIIFTRQPTSVELYKSQLSSWLNKPIANSEATDRLLEASGRLSEALGRLSVIAGRL